MQIVRRTFAALASVMALAACAPIMWGRPGLTQADFNQDNARCRLVARAMNSGDFSASGSRQLVAGAGLGYVIATAISTRADYKDCMEAAGYTEQH